ncbi:MAG: hypothetical protein OXF68_13600 [Gammaproteobacteria bacterium]|nr:hypothetical protein [Gammaproteobacteria bacterium]
MARSESGHGLSAPPARGCIGLPTLKKPWASKPGTASRADVPAN